MGWYYKSPESFPDVFFEGLLGAFISYPNSYNLGTSWSIHGAKRIAEEFRWFRWCLRHEKTIKTKLSEVELNNHTRCSISSCYEGYSLDLVVAPKRLTSLFELNPGLTTLDCQ